MSAYQYTPKWAPGSHHKVSAEVAHAVVSELAEKGDLKPNVLVDVSRDPSAPLHDEFEWDDAIAGEQWRREQARHIIAHLIYIDVQEEKPPIRAFFKIEKDTSEYKPFEVIFRNEDTRQKLLDQALKEFASFRRKYAAITELSKAFNEFESAIKQTKLSV